MSVGQRGARGRMQETAIQTDVVLQARVQIRHELTLDAARDLLDWLEAHDIEQPEIEAEESGLFTIAWTA